MKMQHIVLASLVAAGISLLLLLPMNLSDATTKQRLPEFALASTDYGWTGKFPGEPHHIFGKEINVHIHTRAVPYDPKVLPPVSSSQTALVQMITPALPAILKRVEEAMVTYNDHDVNFREFLTNPHIWLDSEEDNGESWTFVIGRTDNPDFGYHIEFKGTNFIEIWAGT